MLDQRGQLLRAAVGFSGCSMSLYDPALRTLRSWLDSWVGIGHVAVGMHRRGFDLQLTQYDERLASDLLHDRNGALADQCDGPRMGADALARDTAGVSANSRGFSKAIFRSSFQRARPSGKRR